MSLNVMIVESDHRAADQAVQDLTDAGHVVLRCHEPNAPAFPCRGLEDQNDCPLRSHVVDVAVAVRAHPRSEPTRDEDGARCAIMHRVPLVVAGTALLDPYAGFETRLVEAVEDLVGACEAVATAPLERHGYAAREALVASRTPNPALAAAGAVVTRRKGRLLVTLSGLDSLTRPERDAAIVRVLAKVREFDTSARGIDIVVDSLS